MSAWGETLAPPSEDPAYPTNTPPDPVLPCQTLEPIGPPLDGVATPAMWSRLAAPLDRAPRRLWRSLGLGGRGLPSRWASIHYGRIALNAHGWERLRARLLDAEPDLALVPSAASAWERFGDLVERLRSRRRLKELPLRLRDAGAQAAASLDRARATDPGELDTAELARGGLDERAWADLLLPWLVARLRGEDRASTARTLAEAIRQEQRRSAELGRRLASRGIVERTSDIAYLTTEERIRAVHGDATLLLEAVNERRDRVERFLDVQLPPRFWGRPRVEQKESR
jgi:hypothetical protein